jgi:hypothetical protein
MTPETTFEEGLEHVVQKVLAIKTKPPVLIAVYGHPNSGKTHFLKQLSKQIPSFGWVDLHHLERGDERMERPTGYLGLHLLPIEYVHADRITQETLGKPTDVRVLLFTDTNPFFPYRVAEGIDSGKFDAYIRNTRAEVKNIGS